MYAFVFSVRRRRCPLTPFETGRGPRDICFVCAQPRPFVSPGACVRASATDDATSTVLVAPCHRTRLVLVPLLVRHPTGRLPCLWHTLALPRGSSPVVPGRVDASQQEQLFQATRLVQPVGHAAEPDDNDDGGDGRHDARHALHHGDSLVVLFHALAHALQKSLDPETLDEIKTQQAKMVGIQSSMNSADIKSGYVYISLCSSPTLIARARLTTLLADETKPSTPPPSAHQRKSGRGAKRR